MRGRQPGGFAPSLGGLDERLASLRQVVHHLLDPATGRPVRGRWQTASVAAGSCLDANIASTAAIVRGQPAVPWLASLKLPARLVTTTGATVHLAGWPADGDDLPAYDSDRAA